MIFNRIPRGAIIFLLSQFCWIVVRCRVDNSIRSTLACLKFDRKIPNLDFSVQGTDFRSKAISYNRGGLYCISDFPRDNLDGNYIKGAPRVF